MIEVNAISKYYDEFLAVNNISFTINEGEVTGLLGPNGAGKTTTLRMLTSFLKPTCGSITFQGKEISEVPQKAKQMIGYLPESAPLYGDMVVYDYLSYVADIRAIDNKKARILEISKQCGITDVIHKLIGELSKGYKQRVGLAHAMIHDPQILILDEPTSGLDPNQIIEIRNLIKEIGKRKTVILSTHILSEVEATCDRVIIINKGNIVADDRTEALQNETQKEKTIFVTIDGTDYQTFEKKLSAIDGVLSVVVNDEKDILSVTITSSGNTDIRPLIFNVVSENRWILYEMKEEQQSLENIFRHLTLGGANV